MFVIELTYVVPLAEIDAGLEAHVAFLQKHYDEDTFLVSGRKVPRDGGVIVATASSRDALERIVRSDPFVVRGLATFRIVEFEASKRAHDFPAQRV